MESSPEVKPKAAFCFPGRTKIDVMQEADKPVQIVFKPAAGTKDDKAPQKS